MGWLRGGGFRPKWATHPIAAKYVKGEMNVNQAMTAAAGHDHSQPSTRAEATRSLARANSQEVDHDGATELALTIENDGNLYRRRAQPIIKNLAKKMSKGSYNAALATKLWMYLANDGAAQYKKEYGVNFNVPTRKLVAEKLRDSYEEEVRNAADALPKKLSAGHKARAKKQTQLAKEQERYALAKRRVHEREQAKLDKAIGAIERRFNPKIAKLENDIRTHEEKAAHHHAEAHKHG